jgi:hypothetical protein
LRRKIPFFAAIFCLLPLLLYWKQFKRLYWFHDDWDLIDGWSRASGMAVASDGGKSIAGV